MYQLRKNNFLHLGFAAIRQSSPAHGVTGAKVLGKPRPPLPSLASCCPTGLNEYFRCLTQQEILAKIFVAAQNEENLPAQETFMVSTPEEIEKFKAETFSKSSNGKPRNNYITAYSIVAHQPFE